MYRSPGCYHPMARKWQYNSFWIWLRQEALAFRRQYLWQIAIKHKWMQFGLLSLSAAMYFIAGGMCLGLSRLISIPNIFQCYGHESKIGFAQQIMMNSMCIGHTLRVIHWSPIAWLNTSLVIGSLIRKCGLQCYAKIAQYLRRGTLICYWKRMLSLFYLKNIYL